jgi:Signal transduction histidine kinase involved in nitrogen fixation and metabolism regulation
LETLPYLNTYIVISSLFIIALVVSISFIIFPIILRVRRKKISTLNSKFTLYFISIALTPAILLGVLGLVLIELGINDWFNNKIKNVINNSVFVAESYLEEHKETIKGDVYAMSNDLNNSSEVLKEDLSKMARALRTQALIRSLPEHTLSIKIEMFYSKP